LLTRDLAMELGYSAQERAGQLRCLARVLNAVRLRDADGARRHMERLVKGSSEYLAARSPELVTQKVRWGDPG
jgi:DNA-binding GntR family transcriptional regulator